MKNHPKSVILNHCWICETKFVEAGGTEQRHDHHVFPRAYGGVDGPEVSICDAHHSAVHRIGEALIHKKPYYMYLRGESETRVKRLLFLATRIVIIYESIKNDPNKATTTAFSLSARHQKMIEDLKPVLNVRSREQVLLRALEAAHARHFVT
jgi:hypothetical protein